MFNLMSFGSCIHPDDHYSKEDNRTYPSPQNVQLDSSSPYDSFILTDLFVVRINKD